MAAACMAASYGVVKVLTVLPLWEHLQKIDFVLVKRFFYFCNKTIKQTVQMFTFLLLSNMFLNKQDKNEAR